MASVDMTTHQIRLRDSRLYVGGVPATVHLDQAVTPVHSSLAGGFSVIIINGRSVGSYLCYVNCYFVLVLTSLCNCYKSTFHTIALHCLSISADHLMFRSHSGHFLSFKRKIYVNKTGCSVSGDTAYLKRMFTSGVLDR